MTADTEKVAVRGLEGVIAAETRVGMVDGINGKLYYAGFEIDELADKACFEEVVYLLWNDRLPNRDELSRLRSELAAEMTLPNPLVQWFGRVPQGLHPMVLLRSAVSDLALFDPEPNDNSPEATRRKAVRLVAKIPVIIAGMHRLQHGRPLVEPDPQKGIAWNFLHMFTGERPDDYAAETMDLIFVLHADHGFNASTFSARVTASTLSDMYAAVTSAIGTLQGPLHGGANQRVMEMLTEIGRPEDAEEYIEGLIAKGQRIMGFGHRVYKVEDPRARHLRKRAAQVCRADRGCHYFDMSEKIEKKTMETKGIYPNVDFYSATVQQALGIPVEYFTTVFAASRIAGWSAHVIEQLGDNRLIRPKSQFTGKFPRKFVPMDERK